MTDLYVIQQYSTGAIKIGRTDDIVNRLSNLQTGSPFRLRVLLYLRDQGYREKQLHNRLACYNTSGEWFREEALSELPDDIYEQLDLEIIDWWKV